MFVTAAGKALCLQVLFCTNRKTLRWWTWLLSTARSNTRSATQQYLELDTQAVSSAASIMCTVISGHSYVRNRSRQKALCLQVLFCAARKTLHWWIELLSTACSNTRSATSWYIKLDTQVVSSPASIGCTIIGGHSYVRNRSRQCIISTTIISRRQEDNALAGMVAGRSVLQDSISYIIVHRT